MSSQGERREDLGFGGGCGGAGAYVELGLDSEKLL